MLQMSIMGDNPLTGLFNVNLIDLVSSNPHPNSQFLNPQIQAFIKIGNCQYNRQIRPGSNSIEFWIILYVSVLIKITLRQRNLFNNLSAF
jgi:hypothetical protein